ncbi:MAG: hypothetical protein M3R67_10960 [Acidobacteriota bacterium]|nr:hypothetical protein [Acidobacteriota bacterium]
MSSIISRPPMTYAKKGECDPCPCPSCGGLECLCRPRFFGGQLLTDETLNSLDRYIVEKNKLHNRYLHGWGVVCGLEVVCGPCNEVTVRPGYALSPCGEDIIVCKSATVNVCELIYKCKDKERREWECEPFPTGPSPDCRDLEEEWILTVRYDEKSSRGITALKAGSASTCGSSCSCGGSSSCGCGCSGKNGNGGSQQHEYAGTATSVSGKYNYRPAQATIAAQCEPTLTCEGYVFEVCKPLPRTTDKKNWGAMIDRMMKCFNAIVATLPKEPGTNATIAELHAWCCSLKESLGRALFDYPVYFCQLSQALANFSCPDPNQFQNPVAYRAALGTAIQQNLSIIGAEYIRYCICAAFLPPCPEMVCDPRVPLATVTVRKDNNGICRVVRICNLEKRKFVTTFVSLGYWLSFLQPVLDALRKGLETLCCQPFRFRTSSDFSTNPGLSTNNETSSFNNTSTFTPVTNKRGFKAFAERIWVNRGNRVDAQALFLGAIGAKDQNNQPFLAETELANPFYTVMVNNLVGPLLAKLPDNSPDMLMRTGASFAAAGGFANKAAATSDTRSAADEEAQNRIRDKEITDLNERISDLQATVKQQSETLNELRKRVEKK